MTPTERKQDFADALRAEQGGENPLAVVLVTAGGAVLGSVGMALALDLALWSLVAAGVAVIWATRAQWKELRTPGRRMQRSVPEYLLSLADATLAYGSTLLGAYLIAVMFWAGALLVNWLLRLVGVTAQLPAGEIGAWVGYVFGAIMLLAGAQAAEQEMRRNLKSGAYARNAERLLRWLPGAQAWVSASLAIIVGAIVLAWWISGGWTHGFWWTMHIGLLVVILMVTDAGPRRPQTEQKAEVALVRLFEALGGIWLARPRLHDNEADKRLGGLDMVAGAGDRGWGVGIKSVADLPANLEWSAGAGIAAAVDAYTQRRPSLRGIEPLLVLVGGKETTVPESLQNFSRMNGLRVVVFTAAEVERLAHESDKAKLRAEAERLFLTQPEDARSADGGGT